MSKETGLLEVFDSLPDLLALAKEIAERDGGYRYDIQDKLREEYRGKDIPFKWSKLYRHIDRCSQCDYANTAIRHELENPSIKNHSSPLHLVVILDIQIHEIREHQEPIPPNLHAFLTEVSQRE